VTKKSLSTFSWPISRVEADLPIEKLDLRLAGGSLHCYAAAFETPAAPSSSCVFQA
jgi:hypothetical protein